MPSEVLPVNRTERLYVMFFMFFAFSAFAICVALITQTFFRFAERLRQFEDDMSSLRVQMKAMHASEPVQLSVKTYLKHLFDKRRLQARELPLLDHLPCDLTGMLKHARIKEHLTKLDAFAALPQNILFYFNDVVDILDAAPGHCLSRKGHRADAAWVLIEGRLHVTDEAEECQRDSAAGGMDAVDSECLYTRQDMNSQFTVVVMACSELLRVDKGKFYELLANHEEFFQSNGITDWTSMRTSFPREALNDSIRNNRQLSKRYAADERPSEGLTLITSSAIAAS